MRGRGAFAAFDQASHVLLFIETDPGSVAVKTGAIFIPIARGGSLALLEAVGERGGDHFCEFFRRVRRGAVGIRHAQHSAAQLDEPLQLPGYFLADVFFPPADVRGDALVEGTPSNLRESIFIHGKHIWEGLINRENALID